MDFFQQINAVNKQVEHHFLNLSPGQLNWKPAPEKWSIAQCIDHLIVLNSTYFPIFDQLLQGQYKLGFWQTLNPLKKTFGRMMIKSLGPESAKKFITPRIFEPSSSHVRDTVVMDFIFHQDILKKYFSQLQQLDTTNTVIASPASPLITYSVSDAMQIITGHEQRHINQAIQILNHFNFPTS